MQEINWDDLVNQAEEAGKPPAPGEKILRVEEAKASQSQSGKPMIRLRYRIVGGPDDGKVVFDQLVISPDNPNALNITFNTMRHCFGIDPGTFRGMPFDQVVQLFVGKTVTGVVTTDREWNGQKQVDVKEYKSAPSAGLPQQQQAAPPPQQTPQVGTPPPAAQTPPPPAQPQQAPPPAQPQDNVVNLPTPPPAEQTPPPAGEQPPEPPF